MSAPQEASEAAWLKWANLAEESDCLQCAFVAGYAAATAAVREALREFCRHDDDCAVERYGRYAHRTYTNGEPVVCTCGLAAALEGK